jgi:hypothetical protein
MTEASASAPELAPSLDTPTAVHAALPSPTQLGSATPRSASFSPVYSACVPHVRTVVDVVFGFRAQIPCRGRELSALIERLEAELLAVIKHAEMLAQARSRAWMHAGIMHARVHASALTRTYHPLARTHTHARVHHTDAARMHTHVQAQTLQDTNSAAPRTLVRLRGMTRSRMYNVESPEAAAVGPAKVSRGQPSKTGALSRALAGRAPGVRDRRGH